MPGFATLVCAVLINLQLLGALLFIALRVVPNYMEYLTIKDLITRAADKCNLRGESVTDLKVRLGRLLNTNQIYDTTVSRERGAIVIDANYEKRFPVSGYWTKS